MVVKYKLVIEVKISTKGRYALSIMAYLASHYNEDNYITLKEISEKENISLKYLERIIASLNKEGYLLSQRGSEGGYKLSKSPKEYTLYDIISKAEGNIAITSCVNSKFLCSKKGECRSFKLWNDLNQVIINFLDGKTLEDFIKE